MIFPGRRTVFLSIAPIPVFLFILGASFMEWIAPVEPASAWTGLAGAYASLLLLFLADALSLPRARRITAERVIDSVFSIGYPHRVELLLRLNVKSLRGVLYDDTNEFMECRGLPRSVHLVRGGNRIKYRLKASRRGSYNLLCVYLTGFSFLGLAKKVYRIPCPSRIQVYPDLKAVSKFLMLARKSHLGLIGIRKTRLTGGDNEFERLREYQRDDEYRRIDWKASARQSKLIVRTYQTNQNQTLFFMLDCGRMMTAEVYGKSLLDYSLNSILLLSRVALSNGDRVGFLAYAGNVLRYVRPGAGAGHHRKIVQAAYDLTASHEESNIDSAFHYLNRMNRKRSLVCLVTNVIDEMNAELLKSYLGAISGRHLPFAILLKTRDIYDMVEKPPESRGDLYTIAAASDFLLWRKSVIQSLKNSGCLTLESFPEALDAAAINEYLSIKARKLL